MSADSYPPVIVIVGPTGVGKTDIAIHAALRFNGEIISADSRQIYQQMDIGTAKPSKEQLEAVRHYLVDFVDPADSYSLAVFQQDVKKAVEEIREKGKQPFIVGGTGQYIRAIIQGWQPPVMPANEKLRQELEEKAAKIGKEALYDELVKIDPVAAENIDWRNTRRVIRALEVYYSTGELFSLQRRIGSPLLSTVQIGLTRPRPELYARIDQRIENMIADGLLDETKRILASGCPSDAPSFSAIGYREMAAVIRGELTLEEAIVLMKRATRNYVRRQANWFALDDSDIHWFDLSQDTEKDVLSFIEIQLNQ